MLQHASASRQHAALVHHSDGRLFLIDLESVRLLLLLNFWMCLCVSFACLFV